MRAFIDFLWPKTRQQIVKNLFIPYLAFIVYYMLYLVLLKKMNLLEASDPTFADYTSTIYDVFTFILGVLLFLGCLYFFFEDIYQFKNNTRNNVVIWTYANVFPLFLILFQMILSQIGTSSTTVSNVIYSLSAFFIWIRVIHLLKCFAETAFLLRMASQILFKMRYLVTFIFIALIAFGYTYYFLQNDSTETPYSGVQTMFLVIVGNYNSEDFDSMYLNVLFLIAVIFTYFFVFTLLISLAVFAYT